MKKAMMALCVLMVGVVVLFGCSKQTGSEETTGTTEKGAEKTMFELKSEAFTNRSALPIKYAKSNVTGGQNVSVPLSWSGAPSGTKAFALVMVDRNPMADNWIHWAVVSIPATATSIPEGASGTEKMPTGAQELNNTFGDKGYGGPTPPAGTGTHEYEFILYALINDNIEVPATPSLAVFEAAVDPAAIASAKISGMMER
ncbi:MAG: YbhB/YbcL family Raf kinase inhibitor-like protein [Actinomycetota bacterium]